MQGRQTDKAKNCGQPISCQRCHHLQQLQLHTFIKPHQTLVLSERPWCFLCPYFGTAQSPVGRCLCCEGVHLGTGHLEAGAAALMGVAGEFRELRLHHQHQS